MFLQMYKSLVPEAIVLHCLVVAPSGEWKDPALPSQAPPPVAPVEDVSSDEAEGPSSSRPPVFAPLWKVSTTVAGTAHQGINFLEDCFQLLSNKYLTEKTEILVSVLVTCQDQ